MPAPRAQATVAFASRVPTEVDERRRRLQARIGCTVPVLISKALQALEHSLLSRDNSDIERTA
jgi:hypothetical protein